MRIALENLTKKFGNVVGVDDITLDIQDGEFVAFLGPSGCGKTTTLLMVAGIYRPTAGVIRFGERVVNQVAPKDRHIGMVFQSYALYPHMTVFGNISYPLKLQKVPKQEQIARVQAVADKMGIGDLLDRRPGQLSGGQQQRVGIARALMQEPELMLTDEPVASLDPATSHSVMKYLEQLNREDGITILCSLHFLSLARTYADRIIALKDGRMEFDGGPNEIDDRRFRDIYGEDAVRVEIS